jgi:hypothetical protein
MFVAPILFERIHLVSTKQAMALLATLRASTDRSRFIKSITVTIPPLDDIRDPEVHPYHSTLRKLFKRHVPELQHLHLYTSRFISAMVYFKDALRGKVSLKTLTIFAHGYCEVMSTSYIWSIFKEFHELEEFWFEFRSLDEIKPNTERSIPNGLFLPNVRRVGMSGVMISDESVETLCFICPKLEEMEIEGQNRYLVI